MIALLLAAAATFTEPRTLMKFVRIPAGQFTMGSTIRKDEMPHRVTISQAFYMGETEVTQGQWVTVMGRNPSWFRAGGPNAPVERVTWNDVQEFLRRLGPKYRLPTEAEWEYACRAGTTTEYNVGNRLTPRDANFDREATMPVRSFRPNAWGLYDMHGNVWEWTSDAYAPGSKLKVIRGGSFYFGADSARSALRYTHEPQLEGFSIGFRVVRDAD